jgi:hypothetical protein
MTPSCRVLHEQRLAIALFVIRQRRERYTRASPCIYVSPLNKSRRKSGSVKVGRCLAIADGRIEIALAQRCDAPYFQLRSISATELGFQSAVGEIVQRWISATYHHYIVRILRVPKPHIRRSSRARIRCD